MIEFDYKLDYKKLKFTDKETRKLYRIGRGEQGVLLVKPYTNDICKYWKFKTPAIAKKSAEKIYTMYADYRAKCDFVGEKFYCLNENVTFTRARRYANHRDGNKYDENGNVKPQEPDAMTCHFAESATIFREYRNRVAKDSKYKSMRKMWREYENHNIQAL